jgi:glycosyltransferase involved in cell wall biosynthesis
MTQENGTSARIMVLLYGTIEFDGRARRMIEILSQLAEVLLVDVHYGDSGEPLPEASSRVRRRTLFLPRRTSNLVCHARFWVHCLQQARAFQPTTVVAEDFFTTLPGYMSARLSNAKLIYDAHELIIPSDGQRLSARDWFWYMLEKLVVHRADLIIAANLQRALLMQEHYGLPSSPTFLRNIPAFDGRASVILDAANLYAAFRRSSPEDRIVIYQGAIRLGRGLGRFVDAFSYLPSTYRLVVAGDGPDSQRLGELVADLEREGRAFLLGRVPNDLLHSIATCADLGIVSYPYVGLNNVYCAPNKLFEYAQAGLPIIATDQPPLAEIIGKYKIGELVSADDDTEVVASKIQGIMDNRRCYQLRLEPFLREHRWEDEARRVSERILEVIGKRNQGKA